MICNALTIDVEDYFQVSAFDPCLERADWPRMECRVEANIERILTLLDAAQVNATFFTLGWIARRYPAMVKRIVAAGHELACHGDAHRRISAQTPAEFERDIHVSKSLLEEISGQPVQGYRAPSFSLGASNPWAHDILLQAGYRYSSSIYPIRHDHYGAPQAPRFAFLPRGRDGILELPLSTAQVGKTNLPAAGGGYFRFFPYPVSRWLLRHIHHHDGQAGIFYFHPWELDPGQPRMPGAGIKTRFRHYLNLGRTEGRLSELLRDFRWHRVDRIFLGVPHAG